MKYKIELTVERDSDEAARLTARKIAVIVGPGATVVAHREKSVLVWEQFYVSGWSGTIPEKPRSA